MTGTTLPTSFTDAERAAIADEYEDLVARSTASAHKARQEGNHHAADVLDEVAEEYQQVATAARTSSTALAALY